MFQKPARIYFYLSFLLQLFGLYLFTRGFFLMRIELGVNSTCDDTLPLFPSTSSPFLRSKSMKIDSASTSTTSSSSSNSKSCWTPPVYDRLVFVVIDALRYDFADPRYTLVTSNRNSDYQGHMPLLGKRLNSSRSRSRLYRFEADAPTVTMQRLKALTSGCLPTFVDVSANFASSTISEDNFISQGHTLQKKMVFMGDDTWLSLFPSQLSSTRFSFPYPSFDVFDLHTVDNGVLEHLIPLTTLSRRTTHTQNVDQEKDSNLSFNDNTTDWDILIAHFLGVDHVGHRHGPSHPEMAVKLTQMDQALEQLTIALEEQSTILNKRTLLVVLGDHGMTSGGNHGGASEEEVGAALYVRSFGRDLFDPLDGYDPYTSKITMEQIDIVPTLSLAMGLPIPYSSLGLIPTDWLWWWGTSDTVEDEDDDDKDMTSFSTMTSIDRIKHSLSLTNGLYLNAHQVKRFLLAYASVASSLSTGAGYTELQSILAIFNDAEELINNAHSLALALA
jgi:phosphatidylinositol glycan class O